VVGVGAQNNRHLCITFIVSCLSRESLNTGLVFDPKMTKWAHGGITVDVPLRPHSPYDKE